MLYPRTGYSVCTVIYTFCSFDFLTLLGGILHPFTWTLKKEPIIAVLFSWLLVQVGVAECIVFLFLE